MGWVFYIRKMYVNEIKDRYPKAASFFLSNDTDKAILMVHGFSSTPCEVLSLGEFLHKKGYAVKGVLLPGHATYPADLERSHFNQWRKKVKSEYDLLKESYESVSVVGFSLGGLLGMDLAVSNKIDSLVLLAPFIRMSPYYFLNFTPEKVVRFASKFIPYVIKSLKFTNINDPRARRNHITYSAIPIRGTVRIFDLAAIVMPDLHRISNPVLIMHATKDKVVDPQGSQLIYDTISSTFKEIIWLEHSNHIIPLDYDRNLVFDKVENFFDTVYSPSFSGASSADNENTAVLKDRGLPY